VTDTTATTEHDAHLWTLEEISRLVSHSGNPTETLTNIVELIQRPTKLGVRFSRNAATPSR